MKCIKLLVFTDDLNLEECLRFLAFLVDEDVRGTDLDVKLAVHGIEECLAVDCRP